MRLIGLPLAAAATAVGLWVVRVAGTAGQVGVHGIDYFAFGVVFVVLTFAAISLAARANRPAEATPAAPAPPSLAPPPAPAAPRTCPKCRSAIPTGTPEGLCPRCLLAQAMPAFDRNSPTASFAQQGYKPPAPEEVAAFFPNLEIIGLIGHGGMGAVYLARQTSLDRLVALKLLRTPRDDDPTFAERFVREAKAMARLAHPNIVSVYESGDADGLPYLMMEYVDGITLREAIRRKSVSPVEALAIIPQVCDALEYAHKQGVVHRDIKPENILLDKAGRVKIADFGLAKLADPHAMSLTGTFQAMGTPHYMAPEQWERPADVDHRADIYALGVVLYELLTGELPLGRFDPPSVKARVDARIDELVLRALAKEPGCRFQHATDVKTELERIGSESSSWFRGRGFKEYRSKAEMVGWPLVHVVAGHDPRTGKHATANGWIAIGDVSATGAIAIAGVHARGLLAIAGSGAFGVLALAGGYAVGVVALAGGGAAGALAAGAGGAAASFGLAGAGGTAYGQFAVTGGAGSGDHVWSSTRRDPDFGQKLIEWLTMIWTDYVRPF